MSTNYAMMALSVTPLVDYEGAEVDGEVEAGGVIVSVQGLFDLSCASLRRTIATSMAHITGK